MTDYDWMDSGLPLAGFKFPQNQLDYWYYAGTPWVLLRGKDIPVEMTLEQLYIRLKRAAIYRGGRVRVFTKGEPDRFYAVFTRNEKFRDLRRGPRDETWARNAPVLEGE